MAQVNGNGVKFHTNGTVPLVNGGSYAAKFHLADHFIGGNKLDVAPPSKVKDFVAKHDGHTVITNVRLLDLKSCTSLWEPYSDLASILGPDCE